MRQDVWDIELVSLSRARRSFVRAVRVVQLVLRGFKHDECALHASSLTFITLLAFVPVLALALSMARVFGAGDVARDQLKGLAREWLVEAPAKSGQPLAPVLSPPVDGGETSAESSNPTVSATTPSTQPVISLERIEELIDLGFERINSLNFSALGGLGLVFLLWTVIGVLGQVEAAFNRVWGVTEQRPLHRKFTDYLSVLIVVPFLITAASTIPAANLVARWAQGGGTELLPALGIRLLRFAGTVVLLTLSFAFLLRFLPNTRVKPFPSVVGGLCTAVFSLGWLRICAAFQIGVAKNSAFFGSFATVPILLSWVYVSWEILLFGAEVAFAVQNADTYRMEQGAAKASVRTRLMVAVDLLAVAARQLSVGDGLLRIPAFVADRRVSVRLVNDVVRELAQRGFLVEAAGTPGAFAVRRDVVGMRVSEIARSLLDSGVSPQALGIRPETSGGLLGRPLDAALASSLSQRLGTLSANSSDGPSPDA